MLRLMCSALGVSGPCRSTAPGRSSGAPGKKQQVGAGAPGARKPGSGVGRQQQPQQQAPPSAEELMERRRRLAEAAEARMQRLQQMAAQQQLYAS